MLRFPVVFVTFYLVIYCVFLQFEETRSYAIWMLLISPVLLSWMVYDILKYGEDDGAELGEKEFGYQDKSSEDLGVF